MKYKIGRNLSSLRRSRPIFLSADLEKMVKENYSPHVVILIKSEHLHWLGADYVVGIHIHGDKSRNEHCRQNNSRNGLQQKPPEAFLFGRPDPEIKRIHFNIPFYYFM